MRLAGVRLVVEDVWMKGLIERVTGNQFNRGREGGSHGKRRFPQKSTFREQKKRQMKISLSFLQRDLACKRTEQRILCVDDEIAGARLRVKVLEHHGYSVTLYHFPLAVLSCDLSEFDLAILDFQMPELTGRELLLRMRALGARFPIVLLAGCVDALSYEDRVLFARCIDKAEQIKSLLDTIAEFLVPNQIPDFPVT
jgi:CheY-like chemotaxis protein